MMMKMAVWAASSACTLSLLGTGCATHKFVRNTVAPVSARVDTLDKKTSDQGNEIDAMDKDLSKTKERLSDTSARADAANAKALEAAGAAQQADQKAVQASTAAADARSLAEKDQARTDELQRYVSTMNNYRALSSENVLFKLGTSTLTKESKDKLDDIAKNLDGVSQYVIEVEGFTDKTGAAAYNVELSQRRAETVARYLAVEHKVPLRNIHMLGAGQITALDENRTRDERKQNRRVEVRVFVPQTQAPKTADVTAMK